jgi:hypothetical protein
VVTMFVISCWTLMNTRTLLGKIMFWDVTHMIYTQHVDVIQDLLSNSTTQDFTFVVLMSSSLLSISISNIIVTLCADSAIGKASRSKQATDSRTHVNFILKYHPGDFSELKKLTFFTQCMVLAYSSKSKL